MYLKRNIQRALSAFSILMLIALPVFALDLGQAKSGGLVGETNTGYLAAVKPSAEVDALVASINSQRKAQYQKIATKNDISLGAVEARAGLKAMEKTPAGEFIDVGTGWQKK
jgi:uncharacterized protein YdbL (DUF1318 family)